MEPQAPRADEALGIFIIWGSSPGEGRKTQVVPQGTSPHSLDKSNGDPTEEATPNRRAAGFHPMEGEDLRFLHFWLTSSWTGL